MRDAVALDDAGETQDWNLGGMMCVGITRGDLAVERVKFRFFLTYPEIGKPIFLCDSHIQNFKTTLTDFAVKLFARGLSQRRVSLDGKHLIALRKIETRILADVKANVENEILNG